MICPGSVLDNGDDVGAGSEKGGWDKFFGEWVQGPMHAWLLGEWGRWMMGC